MSRLVAIVCLLVFTASAEAATIVITELEDVDFGTVPPTSAELTQRMRFCVNSDPAGPYRVTAVGSGNGGAFELTSGSRQAIAFDVYISRQRGRLGTAAQPGVPVSGLSARAPGRNGRCQPPRAYVAVVVSETAMQTAAGGEYSGTLQLTVAPE